MKPAAFSSDTESVCPVCLKRVPARCEGKEGAVFLVKSCPEHGPFKTLIWQGPPDFQDWRRPKIPFRPSTPAQPVEHGCPFDCGLCPDHRQRTCTVLIEVTGRCNLGCPVCYAGAGAGADADPSAEAVVEWLHGARKAAGDCNLQFSGGEPTVRDDLEQLVRAACKLGFSFVQVNTNGLRLAKETGYADRLSKAGVSSVFLQFDGTTDEIYRRIRGQALLAAKVRAVKACTEAGIGVVLVPTLVPGINTDNVGRILDFGIDHAPGVRGVHFQPVSYFGRHPEPPVDGYRLTLPELMRTIESQTGGRFQTAHFAPPSCEHARCSFHGNYVVMPDGGMIPLSRDAGHACCGAPEPAEQGAQRSISFVARQWQAPRMDKNPGACGAGCGCRSFRTGGVSFDDFLSAARHRTFSVSAMAFQDAWTLNLDRLRDCCIHVYSPERGLVPFCAFNLTAADGRGLYRS